MIKATDATLKELRTQVKKVNKCQNKYATMIRTIYNDFPEGMKYMDIVELLYTGKNGFWTKEEDMAQQIFVA